MRRFEFSEGSSNKFWEIEREGCSFTVRWGRIGTDGQRQTKEFPTAEKTQAEHDKLVAEKLKKGYREIGGQAAPPKGTPASAKAGKAKADTKETAQQSFDKVIASIAPIIAEVSSADSKHAEWRCDWGAMMYDLLQAFNSGQGRPWDLSSVTYSDDTSWLISVLHEGIITVAAAVGDGEKIARFLNRNDKDPKTLLDKLSKEKGVRLSTSRISVPRATIESW